MNWYCHFMSQFLSLLEPPLLFKGPMIVNTEIQFFLGEAKFMLFPNRMKKIKLGPPCERVWPSICKLQNDKRKIDAIFV